jgi:hypothetical protein
MVFLQACVRGFRERPRSGVWLSTIVAVVVLLLSRSWPGAGVSVVAIVALAAIAVMFMPSAIHEAHGRWQLRPRCSQRDGQWLVEIDPRWSERFGGSCVVTDGLGGSAVSEFRDAGDRTSLRFPQDFADVAPSRGRIVVRWRVRQAGNTFDASTSFVWR